MTKDPPRRRMLIQASLYARQQTAGSFSTTRTALYPMPQTEDVLFPRIIPRRFAVTVHIGYRPRFRKLCNDSCYSSDVIDLMIFLFDRLNADDDMAADKDRSVAVHITSQLFLTFLRQLCRQGRCDRQTSVGRRRCLIIGTGSVGRTYRVQPRHTGRPSTSYYIAPCRTVE